MSEYSGRQHYDEPQSDDEAVADSGHELKYRRMAAASGGGVTTAPQQQPFGFGAQAGGWSKEPPPNESESSAESTVPLWGGAKKSQSQSVTLPSNPGSGSSIPARQHFQSGQSGGALPPGYIQSPPSYPLSNYNFQSNDSPPGFFAPFGSVGKAATEGSSSYDGEGEKSDTPCVITLPSTFRLERTNFVVSASSAGQALSVDSLVEALRSSLAEASVDVLEFKPAHCVLECSFHVGNRFLSMNVRIFRAPNRASGQLLLNNDGNGPADEDEEDEQAPFVVEAQLREGDRLHFSALFREIMREFKNQEGVNLAGAFRYHARPHPDTGEGLALEEASMAPSRNSIRLLAEREETMKSGGGAGLGVCPPPVPASMAKTQDSSELDVDMMDDVILLAGMLRGNFLDVQADAATAVAGLTADHELLEQLSRDGASQAANDLCFSSARLLLETQHRPARRQAAVVVANLATTPKLRAALLSSDFAAATPGYTGAQRHLVESLVVLSMGIDVGGAELAPTANKKEEEIGMRRECMRALVGLAECQAVRDTPVIQELLSTEPSGRGASDIILMKRLHECKVVLKSRSC